MAEVETAFKPPKKKREEADLDITPMIDITFLLLAFFVVVSKMDPTTAVALPQAKNGDTVPEKNCVVLIVTMDPSDPKGALIYKGRSKEDKDLIQAVEPQDKESEIGGFIQDQLSLRPNAQGIMIKAEGEVKTGAIELVKRGIAGSELAASRQIFLAVEEN